MKEDWTEPKATKVYQLPFFELLYKAHTIYRNYFKDYKMQLSRLLSVKTGRCPEDCAYCAQSGHYNTVIDKQKLLPIGAVISAAKQAKKQGATRFCMAAAWRKPSIKDFPNVVNMVKKVKKLGLETCCSFGSLDEQQADELHKAGLDYYNHNLDTSAEYYQKIITTRSYAERLQTLQRVRKAGIKVCCGGVIGMGEEVSDRIKLLVQLTKLQPHPESVPINQLIPIAGTPLANTPKIDSFDFIRIIALARIMLPKSIIRLSAGRCGMNKEYQAWCFFAGANSIFVGDKLLTADNPEFNVDSQLLQKLNINETCCKS